MRCKLATVFTAKKIAACTPVIASVIHQISACYYSLRCVPKKYTKLMAITLSILKGFSKFFHC